MALQVNIFPQNDVFVVFFEGLMGHSEYYWLRTFVLNIMKQIWQLRGICCRFSHFEIFVHSQWSQWRFCHFQDPALWIIITIQTLWGFYWRTDISGNVSVNRTQPMRDDLLSIISDFRMGVRSINSIWSTRHKYPMLVHRLHTIYILSVIMAMSQFAS